MVVIIVITVLSQIGAAVQSIILLGVLIAFLVAQLKTKPFNHGHLNTLDQSSMISSTLILIFGLYYLLGTHHHSSSQQAIANHLIELLLVMNIIL